MASTIESPARLAEIWSQQSRWSRAADALKERISRARRTSLILSVAMAVAGTLAGVLAEEQPTAARVLAALVAAATVVLAVLRPRWSGEALQSWTRARSVSEGLKHEVYLYLAGVGDYAERGPALRTLSTRCERLQAQAADLREEAEAVPAEERSLPEVSDCESHFAERVTGQIEGYYEKKARALGSTLKKYDRIQTGLTLLAGATAVLAAAWGTASLAPWIAVVTTIGTSVAVHVAAARYAFQRIEFLRTAGQLRALRSEFQDPSTTEKRRAELVLLAEDTISVENKAWMAKLAEEPQSHTTVKGAG